MTIESATDGLPKARANHEVLARFDLESVPLLARLAAEVLAVKRRNFVADTAASLKACEDEIARNARDERAEKNFFPSCSGQHREQAVLVRQKQNKFADFRVIVLGPEPLLFEKMIVLKCPTLESKESADQSVEQVPWTPSGFLMNPKECVSRVGV